MSFLSLVLVYLFWQSAEIEINFVFQVKLNYLNSIVWGSQTPSHGPVLVCGLLGPRPHSRRWVAGVQAKLHLYFYLLPIACITAWALPPELRSVVASDSHGSSNPTVNCVCKGSRLCAPYENQPQTISSHHGAEKIMKKLSFMKPVPGTKKAGEPLF